MVIMFGMGLTMQPKDFLIIVKNPKDILIGCVAQFTIMPLLAYLLCKVFNLSQELTVGVILVGTCPGGTASNVITYFSKGDVPLSVGMTSINTLLAIFLTPAITYLFLKTNVNIDFLSMFLNIVLVVFIPVTLGLIINQFLNKITIKIKPFLPIISTIGICLIIASVVSHNVSNIKSCGALILIIVIIHNLLGYAFGFAIAKIFKMNVGKTKTLSIEIGMQNSGLASSLAQSSFSNLASATVPGAIFSVWHNISGAILASFYRRWKDKNENDKEDLKAESDIYDKKDINQSIKLFTDYCIKNGFNKELFLNKKNIDEYAKTAANGYIGYPVVDVNFNGKYDEHLFYRMLRIDFKSRLNKSVGIASENYESVLIIEAPMSKKTGNLQYLKSIDLKSFYLLFINATRRSNTFEKYALIKRKPYVDENTWYVYLFATKLDLQRSGYGKKLLNLVVEFAKEYKYKLCLETNLKDNIKLYESFGFKLVDSSIYKNKMDHFVMCFDYNKQ